MKGLFLFPKLRGLVLGVGIFLLAPTSSFCQNLVIDPGLEDTIKCPYTIGRFYHPTNTQQQYINAWRNTTLASPDLHNVCGYNNYEPHTGSGYAGLIMWDPAGTREYISAMLSAPMEAGVCYYVEYYVALKSSVTRTIEQFQISFTSNSPIDASWPTPDFLPLTVHHQADPVITNVEWEKRSFMYTATGGEQWMTFGNFTDNNTTIDLPVANMWGSVSAYFYLDDVTVTKLLVEDISFCEGDQGQLVSNITCPNLSYTWSNGDTDSISTVTSEGIYTLTISDGTNSCTPYDEAVVTYTNVGSIDAGNDVTIAAGESVGLLVTGTNSPNWSPSATLSCANCVDPTASPNMTQMYTVEGVDDFGCNGIDSVTVFVIEDSDTSQVDTTTHSGGNPIVDEVCEGRPAVEDELYYYAPNAISANADGSNDGFRIEGGPFENFKLQIWNRWGELVFETTNPQEYWYAATDLGYANSDVYIFKATFDADSFIRKEIFGHVSVLR